MSAIETVPEAPPQPVDPDSGEPPRWRPWTAPAALFLGLFLAACGALAVDIVAAAFGVHVDANNLPPGLEIIDTAVQDAAFVIAAVGIASMTAGRVAAWQFGLRTTPFWRAAGLVALLYVVFLGFTDLWQTALNLHGQEKLLNQLGANENTTLLIASAVLTCVIAPFCEEFLFRGYIFTALRNWHGPWLAALLTGILFGAVHATSAPAAYLVPLGFLGFGLCLLYWRTRSLLPCIAAHSINNSIAFGVLENWTWQIVVLAASALATLGVVALCLRAAGLIYEQRPQAARAV